MGFLSSLKSIGQSMMADAEKALGRVSSKGTFVRVVQASYLIAAADNNVKDDEKITLGKVIARKLPHFKAGEVAKELEQATEVCALSFKAGRIELMENISKANGTDDARIIMLAVLAVADADGETTPDELKVAREICVTLGLRPQEYGI